MKRPQSVKILEAGYLCRFRPEPEGGYTVTCPPLPAVVSFGETFDEARMNAREAIELCLDVFRAQGQPIPAPDSKIDNPAPIKLSGA